METDTSSSAVIAILREANLAAVLVTDTSVLLANDELEFWRPMQPSLLVISNLVLAELDHHKSQMASKPDQAIAAQRILTRLANAAAGAGSERKLRDGLRLGDDLWVISVPVDRKRIPPALDPKKNDHQIVAVAWMLQQDIRTTPVVLMTADHGQAVFASGAGIDCFLNRSPFKDGLENNWLA